GSSQVRSPATQGSRHSIRSRSDETAHHRNAMRFDERLQILGQIFKSAFPEGRSAGVPRVRYDSRCGIKMHCIDAVRAQYRSRELAGQVFSEAENRILGARGKPPRPGHLADCDIQLLKVCLKCLI